MFIGMHACLFCSHSRISSRSLEECAHQRDDVGGLGGLRGLVHDDHLVAERLQPLIISRAGTRRAHHLYSAAFSMGLPYQTSEIYPGAPSPPGRLQLAWLSCVHLRCHPPGIKVSGQVQSWLYRSLAAWSGALNLSLGGVQVKLCNIQLSLCRSQCPGRGGSRQPQDSWKLCDRLAVSLA